MSWIQLPYSFPDWPQIQALRSDAERWAWVRLLCYVGRTDPLWGRLVIQGKPPRKMRRFLYRCHDLGLLEHESDGERTWYRVVGWRNIYQRRLVTERLARKRAEASERAHLEPPRAERRLLADGLAEHLS